MVQNLSQIPFEEPQVPCEVTPNGANDRVGVSTRSKRVRFGGEPGFENRFENHEEHLLNDAVLEAGRVGFDSGLESAFGEGLRKGGVVWGAKERVRFVVPFEMIADYGITEREQGVENGGADGVTRRKGASGVGA